MLILFQTPHAWRSVWQRPHHLAVQFARVGHRVHWVEPRYVRWLLGQPGRFLRARRERPRERIEVRPATLINGERFAPIRRWNMGALRDALMQGARRSTPDEKKVLWLYHPHEGHLARSVGHDLLVYDIMDECQGFPWSPPGIADEEAALLEAADWVFAGTRALHDAKKEQARGRIECVLSGVDAEHFSSAAGSARPEAFDANTTRELKRLEEHRRRYRRLIGYAGMIDLRVDQPLLVEAARRHRDWGWVLLGPLACDAGRLRAEPNIFLPGQIHYDALPHFYHAWDCALIPFVENELTRHINPTKMLEYAAAGLPVVTRDLPDVRRYYADGAFLYETPEQFENYLNVILGGEGRPRDLPTVREKMDRMEAWLEERSWPALARVMLDRVESLLLEKTAR